MIPKDKAFKLIKIYMYVCEQYDVNLYNYCLRYRNNSVPVFSGLEILTIYLFVGSKQHYTKIKEIHNFAKDYLLEWYPKLISYQTCNYRLNRMVGAVTELSKQLLGSHKPEDCDEDTLIVDSLPIMTCTSTGTGPVKSRLKLQTRDTVLQRISTTMVLSCTLSVCDVVDTCRSLIRLSYPLHLKMT